MQLFQYRHLQSLIVRAVIVSAVFVQVGAALAQTEAERRPDGGGSGALVRWAMVPSPEVRRTGVADLLTAALSENDGIELIERERIDAALAELQLGEALGSADVGAQLKMSRLVGADGLLVIEMEEEGKNRFLRAVAADARLGARLDARRLPFAPEQADTAADELASFTAEVRTRYPQGVELLIGLAPFTSKTFVRDWDHLQRGFANLIEAGLLQSPGVAVLEPAVVHEIVREHELAGGEAGRRLVPVFVEGEFRVLSQRHLPSRPAGNSQEHEAERETDAKPAAEVDPDNPLLHIALRIHQGGREPIVFEAPQMPLAELSARLVQRVPGVVLRAASARTVSPLSVDRQCDLLWEKAERLIANGSSSEAANLLESILLLRPGDLEARMAVIRCLRVPRLHDSAGAASSGRDSGEENPADAPPASEALAAVHDKFVSVQYAKVRHGRYLIHSRQLNPNEALSIYQASCPHMQWMIDEWAFDREEAARIHSEYFWSVAPAFKDLDPSIRSGVLSAASSSLCSRGNLSKPSNSARYYPPDSAAREWVVTLHSHLAEIHNLHIERVWVGGQKVDAPKTYTRDEALAFYEAQYRFFRDVAPPDLPPPLYFHAPRSPASQILRFHRDELTTREEVQQHCRRLLDLKSSSAKLAALAALAELEGTAPSLEVLGIQIRAVQAWLARRLSPTAESATADRLRDLIEEYDRARDPSAPPAATVFAIDVKKIPPGSSARDYQKHKEAREAAWKANQEAAEATRIEARKARERLAREAERQADAPIEILATTLQSHVREAMAGSGFQYATPRYGNLTYERAAEVAWPEPPKYIGPLSPDMDFVLTRDGNVYAMAEWGEYTTLISDVQQGDGRILDIQYDASTGRYSVLTLENGLFVLSAEGDTLAHFKPGDQLPPAEVGALDEVPLRLFNVAPGRYLLWGMHIGRTWLAMTDYREPKPEVRVLLEATQVRRMAEDDHSVDLASWLTYLFWEWHEGKQLLVAGREPMSRNSAWGMKLLTPLWIDIEADSIHPARSAKSEQYPLPYCTISTIDDPRPDRHPDRDAFCSRTIEDPRKEDRRWLQCLYAGGKYQRKPYFVDPKGRCVIIEPEGIDLWKPADRPAQQPTTRRIVTFPEMGQTRVVRGDAKQQTWLPVADGVYYFFHRSGTYEIDLNHETCRRIAMYADSLRFGEEYVRYFYTPRRGLFFVRGHRIYRVYYSRTCSALHRAFVLKQGSSRTTDLALLPDEVQTAFCSLGAQGVGFLWKPANGGEVHLSVGLGERSILDAETCSLLLELPQVEQINAIGAPLDDEGLRRLAAIETLETIQLNGTAVTDSGLAYLGRLPKLTTLYLAGDTFTDAALEGLVDLSHLALLGVSGDGFTEEGLQKLKARHPRLEKIRWYIPKPEE